MLQQTVQLYKDSFSGLRREVWYLSLVLLINRSGAMVIPFLTVYLTSVRGFSYGDAGFIMSAFGFGSVAGSYIGGWITDRFGFYNVQQWSLVGSGFLFWVLGQQTTFWGLCLGIFLLSTVTDSFRPANEASLSYYSKPENRSRAYGLLRLAINLGFSIGPLMAGALIYWSGYSALFIVNGVSCLLAAVAFRLLLPPGRQPPKQHEPEAYHSTPSAYRQPMYLLYVFFLMLGGVAFMQFFGSVPVYLKEKLGYSEGQIGSLIAINGLMIVIMEMPLLHKAGQRYRSLPLIAVGYAMLGLSYVFLQGAAWSVAMSLAFIVFVTIGEMLSMPFASTYASSIAPASRRGEYMGLLSMSWAGAFILAPMGLRWAEWYGFSSLWWLAVTLAAVATVGIIWIDHYNKRHAKYS